MSSKFVGEEDISMNSADDQEASSLPEKGVKEKWKTLLFWLGFSVLGIWALIYGNLTFEKWKDWLIVGTAFYFPLMAFDSARNLESDPRVVGMAKSIARMCQWILAAPFVIVALSVAGWLLFSFFGWLATIPAWAAVIIILLLLRR